jgi:hypothetical protein
VVAEGAGAVQQLLLAEALQPAAPPGEHPPAQSADSPSTPGSTCTASPPAHPWWRRTSRSRTGPGNTTMQCLHLVTLPCHVSTWQHYHDMSPPGNTTMTCFHLDTLPPGMSPPRNTTITTMTVSTWSLTGVTAPSVLQSTLSGNLQVGR